MDNIDKSYHEITKRLQLLKDNKGYYVDVFPTITESKIFLYFETKEYYFILKLVRGDSYINLKIISIKTSRTEVIWNSTDIDETFNLINRFIKKGW